MDAFISLVVHICSTNSDNQISTENLIVTFNRKSLSTESEIPSQPTTKSPGETILIYSKIYAIRVTGCMKGL